MRGTPGDEGAGLVWLLPTGLVRETVYVASDLTEAANPLTPDAGPRADVRTADRLIF